MPRQKHLQFYIKPRSEEELDELYDRLATKWARKMGKRVSRYHKNRFEIDF